MVLGMYREMLTGITAAVAQKTGKIDGIGSIPGAWISAFSTATDF